MQLSPAPPAPRTLRVTVHGGETWQRETFEVVMHEGVEPSALRYAIAARASLPESDFYFTASSDRAGAVVPLSASLPDGTHLTLHRSSIAATPGPASAVVPAATSGTMCTPLLSSASSSAGGTASTQAPGDAASEAARPAASAHRRQASFAGVPNQLEGLERLSRLTTDLANERTLLAWVRTCLAAIRTTFAYLEISALALGWSIGLKMTEVAMATLVISAAATGVWRYFKIKGILLQKVPPAEFGRVTMRPLAVLILLTALSTTIGVYSQEWVHGATHAHPPDVDV